MRVCLVTEEISFGRGAGGIGGAFHELSLALAKAGHQVDIAHVPIDLRSPIDPFMASDFENRGIRLFRPDIEEFVWVPGDYECRSYGLFRHLSAVEQPYDVIHFHDYKGLGYFSLAARQQKIAFPETRMVVQVHGPTRWALEANNHLFTHPTQLSIDFMERQSIARADVLVSPSRYILGWLRQKGWALPPDRSVHVIQNICTHLRSLAPASQTAQGPAREIIFFGRHEERKGFIPFCDTLDLIADDLRTQGVSVTFLGGLGTLNAEDSAVYLAARARQWRFQMSILPDFDRIQAARYMAASRSAVVVIPSPVENSPYTVLEAVAVGKPIITSDAGGAIELLHESVAPALACPITATSLAGKLREAISTGLPPAECACAPEETERQWVALHESLRAERRTGRNSVKGQTRGERKAVPVVVAAVTHFERPAKLFDAVMSLAAQTYPKLQIVVVDDGTRSPEARQALAGMKPLFDKLGVRLIEQENLYLGAARNRAARETRSDYLLFLDDDDIAFPTMIQSLVTAAEATGADVVNCLNLFMPESRRSEAHPFPSDFKQKISYVPLGGPLSLAPVQNTLGAATALIRRTAFEKLGGYSELHSVGHEDLELFVRALQAGMRIEICPIPLYLYEVDRPSMASRTSRLHNAARVVGALDLHQASAPCADLIALNAGQAALENMINASAYLRSIVPQARLLDEIARADKSGSEYPSLVARLAGVLGSREFARAMESLSASRAARGGMRDSGPTPPLVVAEPIAAMPSAVSHNLALLLAVADLKFGRAKAAVAAFSLSFQRDAHRVGPQHRQFILCFAETPEIKSEELRAMAAHLRKLRLQEGECSRLMAAILKIALRAEDDGLARSVVEKVFAAEDSDYLSANPDVARAVRDGGFVNGLAHFVLRGEKEGRAGYAVSRELAAVGEWVSGQRVALDDWLSRLIAPKSAEPRMPVPAYVNGSSGGRIESVLA